MDNVTKSFITFYKLKKCTIAQITGINLTAIVIILLLFSVVVFQQLYYPRIIDQNQTKYRSELDYLQTSFGNITNAYDDLTTKVENYNADEWGKNMKQIREMLESLDSKISYYESSIFNYFSQSRMKRQKWIF
jgi:peptidoglycan hydrolase CwlO-like protein